ncbi:MAG TPA: calcium-binding protein [Allosphingosinicella sp.]|nr:calcium-binding protein [Allosphingosinicella sp.]
MAKLYGNNANNLLNGGKGQDEIHGGGGDDRIFGGGGDDHLYGDAGNDYIEGGAGNDGLVGNAGNDVLLGQDGNDSINAWDGADTINGGTGNDRIDGGAGRDDITGGSGADRFTFAHLWDSTAKAYDDPVLGNANGYAVGVDVIRDFSTAEHDTIDIRYVAMGPSGSPALHASTTGASDGANSFWVEYDATASGHAFLHADKDGDGSADFTVEIFGTFTTLTAGIDIIYQDPPPAG